MDGDAEWRISWWRGEEVSPFGRVRAIITMWLPLG